jgi:hypothetical protein
MAALAATLNVPAHCRRATEHHIPQRPPLRRRQPRAVPRQERGPVDADDVGDLQRRPVRARRVGWLGSFG